jgi:MoaA/NifB/PqqE/SkfB family radical SAM enzyme
MATIPEQSANGNKSRVKGEPLSVGTRRENEKQDDVFEFLHNRILTHYPQMVQILNRDMPAPRMAIVYPTYVCNQDCLWCEYRAENTEHHTIMSKEQLMTLMADLVELGVKGIEFCGGGEPSLHPNLPEAIRFLADNGVSIGILTNGTKLKGDLAEALVDHASYVRIGFDGGTEETIHKVKLPKTPEARFPAVCENFKNMIAMRDERDTKCRISYKVVVDQGNCHEIEVAVNTAIGLRADSIQFKAARMCDSEMTDEQSDRVNLEIADCKEKYRDKIIVIGGTEKINTTHHCWLTPLQLTIDTLGEVFLCCYYRHRKEDHSIGNCFSGSLKDMWYAEKHWEKIDGIKPHECNNLDCRFVKYNETMNQLLVENDAQFEFI